MSTWYDYFWGNTQTTVVADNMSNETIPLLANTQEVTPIGLTGQLDFQSQVGFSGQTTTGPTTSDPATVAELSEEFEKLDLITTSGPRLGPSYTSGPTSTSGPSSLPNNTDKVITKLDKMGLPGQLFCDKLIEFKAILAGSFPLQCFLNEDYPGSDIDIFIGNQSGDIETWIKENLVKKGEQLNISRHMYFIDNVLSSQKYDLPDNVCLNLVRVNTDDVKAYVNKHFDLSFCRVTFDGVKLEVADPWLTQNKVGYVSFFSETTEGQAVDDKTIEKAMKIFLKKNPDQPCKVINSDRFAYLAQRVQKYESRGFTILRPEEGLTRAITPIEAMSLDYKLRTQKLITSDRQVVINRLTKLGLAGQEFINQMVKSKGLMAGSFPLQCVLGESFKDSDIDIFITETDEDKATRLKKGTTSYTEFDSWLYTTYGAKSRSHTYYIKNVLTSKKYQITPNVCINVVKVNRSDMKEFVKTTFDFSFCQTTFDGEKLDYPCPELTLNKIGFLATYDALKPKQGHHITQKQFDAQEKSREKYYPKKEADPCVQCGYDNKSQDPMRMLEMHKIYPDHVQRLKTRKDKYESRGFQIIPHPEGNTLPLPQPMAHAIFMKNRSTYLSK
jgi:hypothetical protein